MSHEPGRRSSSLARDRRGCSWERSSIGPDSMRSSSSSAAPNTYWRIRAGVLEKVTVDLLETAGVDVRLRSEGLVHEGIELAFGGSRHRIGMAELTGGKHVVIYGQTEVTRDLMQARLDAGLPIVYEALDVQPSAFDTNRPSVSYRKDGVEHVIHCEFIAGLRRLSRDQSAKVSQKPRPRPVSSACTRSAGLGCCRKRSPVSHELIYSESRARIRSLQTCASERRSRYYVQCHLDDRLSDWSDDSVLGRVAAPIGSGCRRRRS